MKANSKKISSKSHTKFDFTEFTKIIADAVGSIWGFMMAFGSVIIWVISGPIFGFSDTWQLIINTATTIITFLMVFLIQHTQNRDVEILNLKLDELIRVHQKAHNASMDLSKLSDSQLQALEKEYKKICNKH